MSSATLRRHEGSEIVCSLEEALSTRAIDSIDGRMSLFRCHDIGDCVKKLNIVYASK